MGTGIGQQASQLGGNYISMSDISNWPENLSHVDKNIRIGLAEQLIEKLTGDYFYEAEFDIYLDGNGKNRLYLSLKADIIEISLIEISNKIISNNYYTFDKHFICISPNLILDSEFDSILFPVGKNNIHVKGQYGTIPCPEAIKLACIIIVEDRNDNTKYTRYIKGSESIGPVSYSTGERVLTGIREADRLLRPYIKKKPMLAVV